MRMLALIPAFDAENPLPNVIKGLIDTGFEPADILVVDDGSSDKTTETARAPGVEVITHEKNKGKGEALKSGFAFAIDNRYDAVLTLDADMQHPPELAGRFVDEMMRSGADIILGNRMNDLSNMPPHRRFSNLATTFFVRLWTGKKIGDSQCGYRLIKTDLLKRLDLRTGHYQTETEIILEAARNRAGFSSVDVPTIYNDHKSKLNPIIETLRFIGIMLSYPFRKKKG